jgi:hypothetical protein
MMDQIGVKTPSKKIENSKNEIILVRVQFLK